MTVDGQNRDLVNFWRNVDIDGGDQLILYLGPVDEGLDEGLDEGPDEGSDKGSAEGSAEDEDPEPVLAAAASTGARVPREK
jgi:hypothetical protein